MQKKGGSPVDHEYFSRQLHEIQSTTNDKYSRPVNFPAKGSTPINFRFRNYQQKSSQKLYSASQEDETHVKSIRNVQSVFHVTDDNEIDNSDVISLTHSSISTSTDNDIVIDTDHTSCKIIDKCDSSSQCEIQEDLKLKYTESLEKIRNLKSENELLQISK